MTRLAAGGRGGVGGGPAWLAALPVRLAARTAGTGNDAGRPLGLDPVAESNSKSESAWQTVTVTVAVTQTTGTVSDSVGLGARSESVSI